MPRNRGALRDKLYPFQRCNVTAVAHPRLFAFSSDLSFVKSTVPISFWTLCRGTGRQSRPGQAHRRRSRSGGVARHCRSPTAMDGGSADHAGAVICRHCGRPERRLAKARGSPARRVPTTCRLRVRGSSLRVVVMTAHDEPGLKKSCISNGAVGYLLKPMDSHTLMEAIADALGSGAFAQRDGRSDDGA
ncbi:MAG: response regulator [Woeseia sp.]